MRTSLFIILLFGVPFALTDDTPPVTSRINCFPEQIGNYDSPWKITKEECEIRGCTYNTNNDNREFAPICYMHPDKIGYYATSSCYDCNDKFFYAELAPLSQAKVFDPPIQRVKFTVAILKDYHLQFKFEDMDHQRFEVPFTPPDFQPSTTSTIDTADFYFTFTENPFTFKVIRKSTEAVLFDTSIGGLVLSDRFLQIATRLPSSNLYGLGEHEHPSLKHSLEYKTWPMFARDQPGLGESYPLYGTHAWYMGLENDGNAHAVFLMNSNAMEFNLIPAPGVIVRTIGGILDFHLYTGPTPENVVQQHTEFVGRPFFPPYWSLGFQLARWGYNHLNNMKAAVERTRKAGIPLDVVYADIDHMDRLKDFTLNTYSFGDMPKYFTEEGEANGLHLVIILDPAVTNNATNYDAWNVLDGNDTWVKWPNGTVMMGYVWPPGKTGFPDFFLKRTADVWKDLIVRHSKVIPFDGLWIDMNEPSNFGTNEEKPGNWPVGLPPWSLKCPESPLEDPPYRTYAISRFDEWNRKARLSDKTLCMEAIQGDGKYKNYDVHNLYGFSESEPTIKALQAAHPGRRGFVLSRSTFAGSSHYVAHWLGDNVAQWSHLRRSIIAMLEMSMFGMPHTGPDTCGFLGESWGELCKRWMQLAAFYPYSRNHNTDGMKDQDPGYFDKDTGVADASRFWIRIRYSLIPYMYTLFYYAHTTGTTVARPLFHEFRTEQATWTIDTQFMLGSAYMIVPVVQSGWQPVKAYMPRGKWLNHVVHEKPLDFCTPGGSQFVTFHGNYDVTLFQRGGSITVLQGVNEGNIVSTKTTRLEPFSISVVFGCDQTAEGSFYWDDGDSINTVEQEKYWLVKYSASFNDTGATLAVRMDHESADRALGADLYYTQIRMHGLPKAPKLYSFGGQDCPRVASSSTFTAKDEKLVILLNFNQPMFVKGFDLNIQF